MNAIQKLSVDLYRQDLQEQLHIDPSSNQNTRELKTLWYRSKTSELKRKLQQQLGSANTNEDASDFLLYSNE